MNKASLIIALFIVYILMMNQLPNFIALLTQSSWSVSFSWVPPFIYRGNSAPASKPPINQGMVQGLNGQALGSGVTLNGVAPGL